MQKQAQIEAQKQELIKNKENIKLQLNSDFNTIKNKRDEIKKNYEREK